MTHASKQIKKIGIVLALLMLSVTFASSANIIQNAGFETESNEGPGYALNWRMNDPDDHGDTWGSASREKWRVHSGEYIATIRGTWANAGDYGGWWQENEAEPGIKYEFSVWLWADAQWTATTQELKLEFWNSDRSNLLGAFTHTFKDIGEVWSQEKMSGVAPDGTVWIRSVINVTGAGTEGALQIDDVDLNEAP